MKRTLAFTAFSCAWPLCIMLHFFTVARGQDLDSIGRTENGMKGPYLSRTGIDPFPHMYYWMDISSTLHPKLGTQVCSLGDINLDGYNDLAISTWNDTTFIWYGGPNFTGHEPDMWVLGGSNGILSGDYNGDGYPDIITAGAEAGMKWRGNDRGVIRIYLHNHTTRAYDSVPTCVFSGYNKGMSLGQQGFYSGDVNGDGKMDFIAYSRDETTTNSQGAEYLFLGKERPDSLYDYKFTELIPARPGSYRKSGFGQSAYIKDVNNDGIDDVIIADLELNPQAPATIYEIFYGNKEANFGLPQKTIDGMIHPYVSRLLTFVNINGDNIYDYCFSTDETDPPWQPTSVIWGSKDVTLPAVADTIFPNPWPDFVYKAGWPPIDVGDLNGDGFRDYLVGWYDYGGWGVVFCLYNGGKKWPPQPVGYFTIRPGMDDLKHPIPIKDMDGDGLDDLAIYVEPEGIRWHVVLYHGDRKLTGQTSDDVITPANIRLFPLPARDNVSASVTLDVPGNITVALFSIDGKKTCEVFSGRQSGKNETYFIDTQELPSGLYSLVVETNGKTTQKQIIVQH